MAKDYAKTRSRSSAQRGRKKTKSMEGRLWLLVIVLIVLFGLSLLYLKKEGEKISQQAAVETPTASKVKTKAEKSKTESQPAPKFDFYTMLPNAKTTSDAADTVPPPSPKPAAVKPKVTTEADDSENAGANQAEDSKANKTEQVADATSDQAPATVKPKAKPCKHVASAKAEVAAFAEQQLEQESGVSSTPAKSTNVNGPANTSTYILQLGLFKDYNSADEFKAQLVLQGFEVKIKTLKKNGSSQYRAWMGPYKTRDEAQSQQECLKEQQVKSSIIKP